MASEPNSTPSPLDQLRRLLYVVLLVGLIGTLTDLLLLHHYEEPWQVVPLAVIGLGLLASAWLAWGGGPARVHVFRGVMSMIVVTGAIGLLSHYQGGREFQLEVYPELTGWKLFAKIIQAHAPPALAPGSMIPLGLVGLLVTFRHPSVQRRRDNPAETPKPM